MNDTDDFIVWFALVMVALTVAGVVLTVWIGGM